MRGKRQRLAPLPDRPPKDGFELETSKVDILVFAATALVAAALVTLIFLVFLALLRR